MLKALDAEMSTATLDVPATFIGRFVERAATMVRL